MCQYKMLLAFIGSADHSCVKSVSCVQDADLYGHGGQSPAFVPTFGSVLPTRMVRHRPKRHYHSTTSADAHRECILTSTTWLSWNHNPSSALLTSHNECAGSKSWLRAESSAWAYTLTCSASRSTHLSSSLHWLAKSPYSWHFQMTMSAADLNAALPKRGDVGIGHGHLERLH